MWLMSILEWLVPSWAWSRAENRTEVFWLTSNLEWFFPSWAWSRAKKRLDYLFPDVQMRIIVLVSLLKVPQRHRIEFFKESNEDTIRLLRHLVRHAGEDQVNDADADHSTGGMSWDCASSSVSAPKLTANGLNLLMCTLKCDFVPVEDDKTMFTDLQELGLEFEWGQGTEMQDCIVDMKRHLKLPNGIELVDANKGPSQLGTHGVHYRMHRMDFSIKGRMDVLVLPKRFLIAAEHFAIIGMELKESLNPEILGHAQAQFIAWGLQCYNAYMQVLSDLRSGGVVWWVDKESPPGLQIIRRQFFAGMPALYNFLNGALAALPELIKDESLPCRELQQPRRCKLIDPSPQEPVPLQDILNDLYAVLDYYDEDARNPDVALAAWFPDGGDEPVSFPDEPSLPAPCP